MTISDILMRATKLALPIAHYEFRATYKNPIPEPPYLIYLVQTTVRGSDNKNMIRDVRFSLELYTDRTRDTELEERIEKEILYDVEYDKQQAEIEDEDMFQTSYDFNFTEKIRR